MISSPGWVWLPKAMPGAKSTRTCTASRPGALRSWRCRSMRVIPVDWACAAGSPAAPPSIKAAAIAKACAVLRRLLMLISPLVFNSLLTRPCRFGRSASGGGASVHHSRLAISDQGRRGVDVAVNRLGVGADAVRELDQFLRDRAVDAGNADIETGTEEEAVAAVVEVDL